MDDYRRPAHLDRKPYDRNNPPRRLFGLTTKQYQQMMELQGQYCAICSKALVGERCLDHDHTTNRLRGVLCKNCNTMLGMAGDSISVLQNAIDYLKDPPAERVLRDNAP